MRPSSESKTPLPHRPSEAPIGLTPLVAPSHVTSSRASGRAESVMGQRHGPAACQRLPSKTPRAAAIRGRSLNAATAATV
jgi:hypothetical protein